MKKLTLLVSNSLHYLNVSNHWNIPSNHQHAMDKGKGLCYNCGGEHYSTDFPYPRDEAKIKKSEKERVAHRSGGEHNDGRNGGCGGVSQGDRKKWSNDNKYGDINDYVNSVQNRGNAWM